jgi:hypothetical protein
MPLLTMAHEIGGHATMCLALGHEVTQLGAFYVDCDAGGGVAGRLVAGAGPALNVIASLLFYQIWRRARGDLARLTLWYVWLCEGFAAAGYLAYSGLTGIGDLNPGDGGGVGPLPYPTVLRVLFFVVGVYAYRELYLAGARSLAAMIGQGDASKPARRTVAHVFYGVLCLAALLASLPNPIGLFVTLASATAASFGGNAGLISIGYATKPGEPRAFTVRRNWALLAIGLVLTFAFAALLGPTITP